MKIVYGGAVVLAVSITAWILWPGGSAEPLPAAPDDPVAEGVQAERDWPDFSGLVSGADTGESAVKEGPENETQPGGSPWENPVLEKALGRLEFDDGRLVLDKGTRGVLENAFGALEGPLSDAELAAVEGMIHERLAAPAAAQVATLLRDYNGYRRALGELNALSGQDGFDARHLDALTRLRREHLGPAVAVRFYADDEAYRRFLLERQRIAGEQGLTDAQRTARQTALQDDLLRGVLYLDDRESDMARSLREQINSLRRAGASQAFTDFVRSQALGLAAARELQSSPEARRAWESQLEHYREERAAILSVGLSEPEKRAQLEDLVERYFGPQERAIIEAYRAD